jgi:hypothetical protein
LRNYAGPMIDPTELRAGNADREQVTDALQRAYADGRLSEQELPNRLAAARQARTFGDLDQVVADLPIAPPSRQAPPPTALQSWSTVPGEGFADVPVGSSPENPLVLDAGWSSAKRSGAWEIPQFLRLRGSLGSVSVDCTEAHTAHSAIHMWVDGDLGSISVIVPEGWAADPDGLRKSLGSIHCMIPKEPTMGRPTIVLYGSMGLGSLTIRHPNWFERRRLQKRLR